MAIVNILDDDVCSVIYCLGDMSIHISELRVHVVDVKFVMRRNFCVECYSLLVELVLKFFGNLAFVLDRVETNCVER